MQFVIIEVDSKNVSGSMIIMYNFNIKERIVWKTKKNYYISV
jgi:hypothetical protein